jgi:hypothetical protein
LAYLPKRAKKGDTITADAWNALREEVRRLGQVSVTGLTMRNGPGGISFGLTAPPFGTIKAIADGVIPARVSATEDGAGSAVLYDRTPGSPDRAAGATVTVYNSLDIEVPDGTTIIVAPSPAGDYELLTGDCPP